MNNSDIKEAASKFKYHLVDTTINEYDVNFEEDNYESGKRDALLDYADKAFIAGISWFLGKVWHKDTTTITIPKDGELCLFTWYGNTCMPKDKERCLVIDSNGDAFSAVSVKENNNTVFVSKYGDKYDMSKVWVWTYMKDILPFYKIPF